MKSQPENSTFSFLPTHRQNPKKLKELFLANAEQNCGNLKGLSRKVKIKVFDIHGNDYRFFEIEGKNNIITEKLDLKELAAGVYFISFISRNLSQVEKIVVQ